VAVAGAALKDESTLTFALMDEPFESARTVTAFRILHAALSLGNGVNVFAYRGTVALGHSLPRQWVIELMALARANAVTLDWVNCDECADGRTVIESTPGVRSGSPVDFWRMAETSTNTLVIPMH
jgi:tRNA 2-thiouridine synthesizing protein D